jgi:hypothetical protein
LWRSSIAAGAAVLDKEQSRLVPGYRSSRKDLALSQWELEQTFERMGEAAIRVLETPDLADNGLQEKLLRSANDELRRRQNLIDEVNAMTLGDDGKPLSARFPPEPAPQCTLESRLDPSELARAIVEIRRRADLVRPVLRDAISTPVYALVDPERWQGALDSTERTADYERDVLGQHRASAAWRRQMGHEREDDVR